MIPASEFVEGNRERVEWMKKFFNDIYTHAHPEAASLEEKIERL
jgi:hypothetical protein